MFNYNLVNPVNIHYRKHPQAGAGGVSSSDEQTKDPNNGTSADRRFPNGNKVAIDYTKNQINISQILQDFRSTISAINSPDDVKDEVETYLALVTKESAKPSPSREIVLANLQNAARVTDKYIQDSLKKPSNVVQDWVNALFLQQINLKADPNEINEEFRVQIPKKQEEKPAPSVPQAPNNSAYLAAQAYGATIENNSHRAGLSPLDEDTVDFAYEPSNPLQEPDTTYEVQTSYVENAQNSALVEVEQDEIYQELKKAEDENVSSSVAVKNAADQDMAPSSATQTLLPQDMAPAKNAILKEKSRISYAPTTKKEALAADALFRAKANFDEGKDLYSTLKLYDEAIEHLEGSENVNLKSAVYFERGKVFDSCDYPELALIDFHKATKSYDGNLQAQAHLKMGNIYDDYAEIEPAIDQYSRAIVSSEEVNNLQGKTRALRYIASMFTRLYDRQNVDVFSELAMDSATESGIAKTIANTFLEAASNYKYIGDDSRALEIYGKLAQNSAVSEDYDTLALNYKEASILMDKKGNRQKAYALMLKSQEYSRKARLIRADRNA